MTVNAPPRPVQTPRRPPQKARRWTPYLIVGGAVGLGMMMLVGMVVLVLVIYLTADRLPNGVSVAGVDVGGKSTQEAKAALSALDSQMIIATDGAQSWPLTLADLGATVDMTATVRAAQKAAAGEKISPTYTIDLGRAQNALVALSAQVNIAAVPPSQNGRAMEIPVTLDRLRADVDGELGDGILDLDIITVEPPKPEPGKPYSGVSVTHIVESGQELALIARQYGVSMQDIVALNGIANPDLLYVGQELLVPAPGRYTPSAADAPPAPTNTGKSIVVSTGEQRIFAYENGQLVRAHLVSTGRSETPTVLGDYKVYVKYVADDMAGPGYFLPQVPYTMYFYAGYGIHGTYWHNSFGRPMSHGCVNLPISEAEWFFNWAQVGTPVRVI